MDLRSVDMIKLIATVREVAAERPTRVLADDCRYFDQFGAPVCLIGCALARLGCTDNDEVTLYATLGGDYNETGIDTILVLLGGACPPKMVMWLQLVQFFQDSGTAWGKAVENADNTLADLNTDM